MDSGKPFWSLARDIACVFGMGIDSEEIVRRRIEKWMRAKEAAEAAETAAKAYIPAVSAGEQLLTDDLRRLEKRVGRIEMMAHLHEKELATRDDLSAIEKKLAAHDDRIIRVATTNIEQNRRLDELENINNPPVRLEQFVKLQETVATFNNAVLEHGRRLDMIKDSVLEHDERLRKIEARRTSSLIRHQAFDETGKAIYDRYVCPRCGGSFDASSSIFESESVCPFCGPLTRPCVNTAGR